MQRRKLTAIRTETVEQMVIRQQKQAVRSAGCSECGADSAWLNVADACAAGGMSRGEILELAGKGALHSSLTPDGHLLICGVSLGTTILKGEQNNEA